MIAVNLLPSFLATPETKTTKHKQKENNMRIGHYLKLLDDAHNAYMGRTGDWNTFQSRLPPGIPIEVISTPGPFGHRMRDCVARDLAECEQKAPTKLFRSPSYCDRQFRSAGEAYRMINGSPRGWLG